MPYPNEHTARVKNPDQYDRFARKEIAPGIDVILGIKNGKSEVQAYRFDKNKFTPEQAKKWLKDHDVKYIAFEPAEEKKEESKSNGKMRYFNASVGDRKFVKNDDGSFEISGVIALASGTWTDSNIRTPCFYPPDVLEKKFEIVENGVWARHSGGTPRNITEKIGVFEDEGYDPDIKGRRVKLILHGATQLSRDVAEMIERNLVNYVSAEIGGREKYDPEIKAYIAEDVKMYGLAIVDKGACDVCVIRHEAEPEEKGDTMDDEVLMSKFDEIEGKIDELKGAIEALVEKLAPPAPAEEEKKEEEKPEKTETSELSELIEEIRELKKKVEVLEKTPAPRTLANPEEEKIYL